MSITRRIATAAIVGLVAVALAPSNAYARPVQSDLIAQAIESSDSPTRVTTATAQDLAPTMTTAARAGEGVIRITTRICGNANNWQNVAAANNIRPPVYLVLLGQQMVVSCVGGTSVPAPQQPAVAASGWVRPVNACIISGFGMRWGRMHNGVDLAAAYGVAIRAAASGTLSVGYQSSGAGNYSMIQHGGGLATVYMHQSRFAVISGHVNAGQIIGYVGATGNAQGPHLHFEVHTAGLWNGRVNPATFMAARGVGFNWC